MIDASNYSKPVAVRPLSWGGNDSPQGITFF